MGSVAAPYTAPGDMLGVRCTGRLIPGERDDVVAVIHFENNRAFEAFRKASIDCEHDWFFDTLVDQCVDCVAEQTGRCLDYLPKFFASDDARQTVASSVLDAHTGSPPAFGVLVSTGKTSPASCEAEASRLARASQWSSDFPLTMEKRLERARSVLRQSERIRLEGARAPGLHLGLGCA